MLSKSAAKFYSIPSSAHSTVEIGISEPDVSADNLSLTMWTSSFILASQLHKLNINFDEDEAIIPMIELGAGTGLVSLAAAVLWKRKPILTDVAGIVPALRENIKLNAKLLKEASVQPECGTLDWTAPDVLELDDGQTLSAQQYRASVIFAADTIYDEDHPAMLARTIFSWLARTSNARVIFTYPLRVCYLDCIRELWTLLEEGGMIAEHEGQERADVQDWDDECLCEWVVWKWKDV